MNNSICSKAFILVLLFMLFGASVSFSKPIVYGSNVDEAENTALTSFSTSADNMPANETKTGPAIYNKITSVDQLIIGEKYIIVYEKAKVALGLIDSKNTGTTVPATISKGVAEISSENSKENPYEITLSGTAGSYILKTEQGTLGWKRNNEFSIDGTDNRWNITFNKNGDAVFSDNVHNYGILYNNTLKKFLTYAQSNKDYPKCQIYKKEGNKAETGSITISQIKYMTFYSEKAFVMPAGIVGGIVIAANKETGKLKTDYRYTEGKTVPAKTALLIKGEAGTYVFNFDDSCTETPVDGNMMHATVDAQGYAFVEGNNVKYYMLSYNSEGKDPGFYWGKENGAPFKNNAPHAYLAIDDSSKASPAFVFDDNDSVGTTNINVAGQESVTQGLIHSITGVCMGSDFAGLPKGIYIKDGKKIIKR